MIRYKIIENETGIIHKFNNTWERDEFLRDNKLSIHGEIIVYDEYIAVFGSYQVTVE
jgi:hypothetical protein